MTERRNEGSSFTTSSLRRGEIDDISRTKIMDWPSTI